MFLKTPINNYGSASIGRRYANEFPPALGGSLKARPSTVRQKIFIHEMIAVCLGAWLNPDQMVYSIDMTQHEKEVDRQKALARFEITVGQIKELEAMVYSSLKLEVPKRLLEPAHFDYVPVTTTLYKITEQVKKTLGTNAIILIDSFQGPYYKGFKEEILVIEEDENDAV